MATARQYLTYQGIPVWRHAQVIQWTAQIVSGFLVVFLVAWFFINIGHNSIFNYRDPTPEGYGYAVFGEVVEGMDVVDDISRVRTTRIEGMNDVPRDNVVIHRIRRLDQ